MEFVYSTAVANLIFFHTDLFSFTCAQRVQGYQVLKLMWIVTNVLNRSNYRFTYTYTSWVVKYGCTAHKVFGINKYKYVLTTNKKHTRVKIIQSIIIVGGGLMGMTRLELSCKGKWKMMNKGKKLQKRNISSRTGLHALKTHLFLVINS